MSGRVWGDALPSLLRVSGRFALPSLIRVSGRVRGDALPSLIRVSGRVWGDALPSLIRVSGRFWGDALPSLLRVSGRVWGDAAGPPRNMSSADSQSVPTVRPLPFLRHPGCASAPCLVSCHLATNATGRPLPFLQ